MEQRYFDDLSVGQTFAGPEYFLSADEIVEFARKYDPQYFHTEPARAHESFFKQHVASGWQTMAIGMRLLVLGDHHFAGGMIGLRVDGIKWVRPTVPGTWLKLSSEVTTLKNFGRSETHGVVELHNRILDARSGELLATMDTVQIVLRRA